MTSEHLREALNRHPFVPITLKTTQGADYTVEQPDRISFSPGGRMINLWVGADSGIWLDLHAIESIRPPAAAR